MNYKKFFIFMVITILRRKQKIAILRELYKNVDVLILDEITANIDKSSAIEIFERVVSGSMDKIIFVITHDDLIVSFCNKEIIL